MNEPAVENSRGHRWARFYPWLLVLLLGTSATFGQDLGDLLVDASGRINFYRGSWGFTSEGIGGGAWLDYDDDGDLDLFVPNRLFRFNALYRNNGNGTFTDIST